MGWGRHKQSFKLPIEFVIYNVMIVGNVLPAFLTTTHEVLNGKET
jgi:hypothetical protein